VYDKIVGAEGTKYMCGNSNVPSVSGNQIERWAGSVS